MNELIKVSQSVIGNEEIKTVNARELHEFLKSKRQFANWIIERIKKYGFIEGQDFLTNLLKTSGRPEKEYHISLDMAKELSMVESNEQGKKARQYFIEVEKKFTRLAKNSNAMAEAIADAVMNRVNQNAVKIVQIENENKLLRLFAPKCGLDRIGQDDERQKIRRGSEIKNSGKGRPMSLVFNILLQQPELPFVEFLPVK
jgi:phage anti-repressor protein